MIDISGGYTSPSLVDDVRGGLRLLQKMRFRLILLLSDIFSNPNTSTQSALTESLSYIQDLFFGEGIKLDGILYSPQIQEPDLLLNDLSSPEMLLTNAIRENDVALSVSWLISSQPGDMSLSHQVGLRPILINQDNHLLNGGSTFSTGPEFVASSIRDVAATFAQYSYSATYSSQYTSLN